MIDGTPLLHDHPSATVRRALDAGYTFTYQLEEEGTLLVVFASLGEEDAGWADFEMVAEDGEEPVLCCTNVEVAPPHRHSGVATTMYVLAERVSGRTLANANHGVVGHQTDDGAALWAQRGRPFGR